MEIKASIPEKRLPYAVLDNVEICSQVMTATLTEQSWVYNVEVR